MPDSIAASVLNKLGLTGGVATNSIIPRAPTPQAEQDSYADFLEAGRVADPTIISRYASITRRPSTLENMLQLWDEMSNWDLMAAALREIVDECIQKDEASPATLWYECNDTDFQDELNEMLERVKMEDIIASQVHNVAGLGNSFEKIEYAPGEGVLGLCSAHPFEMRRYWLERNRQCIGFRWMGRPPPKKADPFVIGNTPIPRVDMPTSGNQPEQLWYPWDFCTTSDTKVSLLDGRELSIQQIQEEFGDGEFWVYSSTPEGRIVPGRAHSLRLTRRDTEIVEIELDNGEKVKFTPDHPFMLRDGTYRNAGDLKPGDSLMPLYRKHSTFAEHGRDGYELFFDNKCQKWLFTETIHTDFDKNEDSVLALDSCLNHKVVAVRPAGKADVYDFTVDGQHNFAISAGVFVHNCHFRMMYRMRETEHGEPLFENAQGIYKKLRIAIDQMVVHRAQVQPDRYAINIDTQEQTPIEQMKTIQRWKQSLRSKTSFGQGSSTTDPQDPTDFKSFYNALALDTILYVARPKGYTHSIEKIAGTANVPDVYDIEMLTNLFFSIIGMPKSWLGISSSDSQGSNPASGKALLAQDMRFLRKIRCIRRPILNTYIWLGYFHAILKGKDITKLSIKARMSPISSLEDQFKMEILSAQAAVLGDLAEIMTKYNLPKSAWIEVVFKRYLHLPDDVVNVFMTALPDEALPSGTMEGRKPGPGIAQILTEISGKIGKDTSRLFLDADRVIKGKLPEDNLVRYRNVESVLAGPQSIKPDDLVVSGFGQKNPLKRPPQESSTGAPQSLTEEREPAWRKYVNVVR